MRRQSAMLLFITRFAKVQKRFAFFVGLSALVSVAGDASAKPIGTVDGVAIEPEWAKAPWPTERDALKSFAEKADREMTYHHWWRAMALAQGVPASLISRCEVNAKSAGVDARISVYLANTRFVGASAIVERTYQPLPIRRVHWLELRHE